MMKKAIEAGFKFTASKEGRRQAKELFRKAFRMLSWFWAVINKGKIIMIRDRVRKKLPMMLNAKENSYF